MNLQFSKAYTFGFFVIAAAIIYVFHFGDWSGSGEAALRLAKMDHKNPADSEVVKIQHLLKKFSSRYHLPVEKIEYYTALGYRFRHFQDSVMKSISSTARQKNIYYSPGNYYKMQPGIRVSTLVILEEIDKIPADKHLKYGEAVNYALNREMDSIMNIEKNNIRL